MACRTRLRRENKFIICWTQMFRREFGEYSTCQAL
jgi:hypothetical protein